MPTFLPFQALRPPRDKAHLVASRSYISYSKAELSDKLEGNPYTFLHLINPETSLGIKVTKNTRDRFRLVSDRFEEWCTRGYFVKDAQAAFYIYKQCQEERSFTGIIGCTSVDDYANGRIKIHEQTITEREDIFKDYLDLTNFHAEPVLLTYPHKAGLDELLAHYTSTLADFDFSTTDKTRHQLWLIQKNADCELVKKYFAGLDAFYIADGHHRSASSLRLAEKRRLESGKSDPSAAYNFFMSCLIPDDQLHIAPFHRLVKDLNGLSETQFLKQLTANFKITPLSKADEAEPKSEYEFGMNLQGSWYKLELINFQKSANAANNLNTQLLTDKLLVPILGITDLKTDQRISCIGGIEGAASIEKSMKNKQFEVAFWLYPIAVDAVKTIADEGLIMPPKSTWVEPKLRSGLTVFKFDNGLHLEF